MKAGYIIAAIAGLMIILLFYWFQIRPSTIKSGCANEVIENLKKDEERHSAKEWQNLYDLTYESCLNKRGL